MAVCARRIFALLLLTWLGVAMAQNAPGVDAAALKERIGRLPATTVDLRAAAPGMVRPAPLPRPESPTPSQPAGPGMAPPTAAPKAAVPAPDKPVGVAPPSAAAVPAAGIARYVPLPEADWQAARKFVAAQVRAHSPTAAATEVEVFRGAVMIRADDGEIVTLVPVVMIDQPLRFERGSRVFEGRIAVGLQEVAVRGPAKKLSAAIGFQVFGDGRADPEIIRLDSTSPPFVRIRFAAPDPRDGVELRVVSNVSTEPVPIRLPVERARLQARAKLRLQGWGLEATEVTVGASDAEAGRGEVVVLSAPLGSLTPATVTLGDDGTARATLRSESTGRVRLEATSPRLQPAALEIEFEFPSRFLAAGLVGGLGGGLLRLGAKRRRSGRRLALDLALGVLTGALVFGLFVLGVNVVGFGLPRDGGELLVAVVAALGAYFGTGLLGAAPATKP